MKNILAIVAGIAVVSFATTASAQGKGDRVDFGKREFEANCASCHGINGKGNGPMADLLKKSPPDLTQLAKKNNGVFPIERLYRVIDGTEVASHGSREMPVWGRDYKVRAAEYYFDVPYDPEAYVRTRILTLLEYLNRLQAK
jgi:mono/diheme cytochrome c family protein